MAFSLNNQDIYSILLLFVFRKYTFGMRLFLSTGTFTDMGYLQEVKFTHCNIASLTSNMLSNFGSLNSLMFEYGSIASYTADFLTGLTIEAQSVSVPKGELVIKDCTISPTDIPAGLFDPLTAAKVIRIEHAGVTTINSAAFSLAEENPENAEPPAGNEPDKFVIFNRCGRGLEKALYVSH
jgi:hypothetical protein